jgi:1-deoxy-D-xylulose-5-phosphate synthase
LEPIEVGTGQKLRDGEEVAVLSIGPIGNDVARAVEGTKAAHYDMRFLKPLDENILHEVGRKFRKIVTVENGVRNGGLGSAVLEWMNDHGYQPQVVRLGLPDNFVEHGTVAELQKIIGLDVESIKRAILAP